MGVCFRSPHGQASILGAGSFMSNSCTARPDNIGVTGKVDLPACVGIK